MVAFGSKSAPLVWSRIAAAAARMGASVLRARLEDLAKGKMQLYLDDPFMTLIGTLAQRNKSLVCH